MATKDGLLGKDFSINYVLAGRPLKLETEKFNPKPKMEELKKHPLGEDSEHVQTLYKGWEIDAEGESVDRNNDLLFDAFYNAYLSKKPTPQMTIVTTEVYADGTVVKYQYTGITIASYEATNDGGDKPRKWKMKFHAKKREEIK